MFRVVLVFAFALCGCANQQTSSMRISDQIPFPPNERIIAERFLRAIFAPEEGRYSISIDPELDKDLKHVPIQERKATLEKRLRDFRAIGDDVSFMLSTAVGDYTRRHTYGRLIRSSGAIEYFASSRQERRRNFTVKVTRSPKGEVSIDLIFSAAGSQNLLYDTFLLDTGERKYRYVSAKLLLMGRTTEQRQGDSCVAFGSNLAFYRSGTHLLAHARASRVNA